MAVYDLAALLERFTQVRALTVGDVMLDRFIYGVVERISPEGPVPVMSRSRESVMLGGAGNVARNLAAFGLRVVMAGFVGPDDGAAALEALIEAEPRLRGILVTLPTRPTTVKARFSAGGQQLLRVDVEDARPANGTEEGALIAAVGDGFAEADVILVSDYAKGAVQDGLIAACRAARERTGAPIIVDPKGTSFARYGDVDLVKPNAKELALVTGLPTGSDAEVETALTVALERCAARAVLVTRAAAGMSLAVRGEGVRHFAGRPRQVFDVSGAGDTVLAALGAVLGAGGDLETAVGFALLASGLAVGKAGTAVVTPAELLDARRAENLLEPQSKILSPEAAEARLAGWRAEGAKIGFTNGCFDILHRGHVAYLAESRRRCDRLVVGLNTDPSVRRLKGPGRPVNDLASRAEVLAALSSVDLVTPFPEDTPLDLITRLRPDILMKGADYALSEVVGAEVVQELGGEVALIPLVEGYSTTATLKRWSERA